MDKTPKNNVNADADDVQRTRDELEFLYQLFVRDPEAEYQTHFQAIQRSIDRTDLGSTDCENCRNIRRVIAVGCVVPCPECAGPDE